MKKHGLDLVKLQTPGGGYRIDGTSLLVQRYERKKYGAPAEWDIVEEDRPDRALVTGTSLDDAIDRAMRLLALLRVPA